MSIDLIKKNRVSNSKYKIIKKLEIKLFKF